MTRFQSIVFSLVVFAAIGAAATAQAPKKYLDTTGLETLLAALQKDGDYHLIVKGGTITVFPIQVITLSSAPNPPQSSLRQISRTTATADPEHTRDLIIVLTVIIARHQEVAFSTPSSVQEAYQNARDKILNTQAKRTLWKGWLEGTRDQLLKMGQEGKLNSADQYISAVTQIRNGLQDSLGNLALEAVDIGEVITLVLEVLKTIGSGEGVNLGTIFRVVLTLLESLGQQFTTGA